MWVIYQSNHIIYIMAGINPKKWSTKRIEDFLEEVRKTSTIPRYTPFFQNDEDLLAPNLDFGMTEHEIKEFAKCEQDVFYFAENYAHIKTDDGYKRVSFKGRDYQKKTLAAYVDYRFNVFLASRQIGKAIDPSVRVTVMDGDIMKTWTLARVFYHFKKLNGEKLTMLDKIRLWLYEAKSKLKSKVHHDIRRLSDHRQLGIPLI